ncbi:MAG: aminopeptidase P family protein [Pyrinomonadaceae bacterium]
MCACPLVLLPARAADSPPVPLISVTPAEPEVDQTTWQTELAARRARVAEQLGPKSVLVLFSGEPRVYAGDVDYEFRQENNLYYLTQLKQDGATLVLLPGNTVHTEILFLPRRRPAAETWTGHMYSPEEAHNISGINEIWEDKEFEPFMRGLRTRRPYQPKPEAILFSTAPVAPATPSVSPTPGAAAPTSAPVAVASPAGYEPLFKAMQQGEASLYLLRPGGEGESREFHQEQEFAAKWAQSETGFVIRSAWPIFAGLRLRKSPPELQLLQHAVDISIEAHERAQAAAVRAAWEYEVEAEVDYTFKRRHADNWGYPNIVGCGPSATTLHYESSEARVTPGQLMLMDVGAEYEHYSADVTRTFPVNGRFSPAQADIYNVVLAAQDKAMSIARPGATLEAIHNAALEVIKDGLLRLGLITDRNSSQYRIWFMHGTSHFIGMNVHDVGRPGALEPNMVFTIEPGVYVRPDALDNLPDTPEMSKFKDTVRPAFEKYKGIGVRIEDDVLITPDGYRNMSAALPRTIADIESFHTRAARELHNEPPH